MHILPISAKEVEAKLLTIPNHWGEVANEIVDQTYSPESTNAQSGIAMAGALESLRQIIDAKYCPSTEEVVAAVLDALPTWTGGSY